MVKKSKFAEEAKVIKKKIRDRESKEEKEKKSSESVEKRLSKEVALLGKKYPPFKPIEGNMRNLEGFIETERRKYKIKIKLSKDFPEIPPSIQYDKRYVSNPPDSFLNWTENSNITSIIDEIKDEIDRGEEREIKIEEERERKERERERLSKEAKLIHKQNPNFGNENNNLRLWTGLIITPIKRYNVEIKLPEGFPDVPPEIKYLGGNLPSILQPEHLQNWKNKYHVSDIIEDLEKEIKKRDNEILEKEKKRKEKIKERLSKEAERIHKHNPNFGREGDDLRLWRGFIKTPLDKYNVEIKLPEGFPDVPPEIKYLGGNLPSILQPEHLQNWKNKYHVSDIIKDLEKKIKKRDNEILEKEKEKKEKRNERLSKEAALIRKHNPNFGNVGNNLELLNGFIITSLNKYKVEIKLPEGFPDVPPEIKYLGRNLPSTLQPEHLQNWKNEYYISDIIKDLEKKINRRDKEREEKDKAILRFSTEMRNYPHINRRSLIKYNGKISQTIGPISKSFEITIELEGNFPSDPPKIKLKTDRGADTRKLNEKIKRDAKNIWNGNNINELLRKIEKMPIYNILGKCSICGNNFLESVKNSEEVICCTMCYDNPNKLYHFMHIKCLEEASERGNSCPINPAIALSEDKLVIIKL